MTVNLLPSNWPDIRNRAPPWYRLQESIIGTIIYHHMLSGKHILTTSLMESRPRNQKTLSKPHPFLLVCFPSLHLMQERTPSLASCQIYYWHGQALISLELDFSNYFAFLIFRILLSPNMYYIQCEKSSSMFNKGHINSYLNRV